MAFLILVILLVIYRPSDHDKNYLSRFLRESISALPKAIHIRLTYKKCPVTNISTSLVSSIPYTIITAVHQYH